MTDEKKIITGIDIGTTKIAVVIAEWANKNEMKIKIYIKEVFIISLLRAHRWQSVAIPKLS